MGTHYARQLFASTVAVVGIVLAVAGIVYTGPGLIGYTLLILILSVSVLVSRILLGAMGFEGLLKLLPGFRPSDPQSIRESHHENIMAGIMEDFSSCFPSEQLKATSKYSVKCQDRLCARAQRYKLRADMHWGRSSSRRRFKAAWLYVTAADIYVLAARPEEACNLYHFAANSFREVESFERSIEYYQKSSELADDSWRIRCLRRAIGVSRLAGDSNRERDLQAELATLQQSHMGGALSAN